MRSFDELSTYEKISSILLYIVSLFLLVLSLFIIMPSYEPTIWTDLCFRKKALLYLMVAIIVFIIATLNFVNF